MKYRKKIDDLYRERLHNVETPPPADSWEYISSRLPEKKKNRAIPPLWLRAAGVAALLAVLFTFFTYDPLSDPGTEENRVTERPVEQIAEPGTSTAFEEDTEERTSSQEAVKTDGAGAVYGGNMKNASEATKPHKASEAKTTGQQHLQPVTEALVYTEERNNLPEVSVRPEGLPAATQLQENAVAAEEVMPKDVAHLNPEGAGELTDLTEAEALAELKKGTPEEPTDKDPEKTAFLKRFRVSTTAGAVYFDNLGSGSTLDEKFAENAGRGEISMSYGVNLAYQVSEKVKVRSGLNKVNLTYNTRNVDYYSAMQSQAISEDPAASGTLLAAAPGSLSQELGFIEVPVEVEYTLLDKKIGLNIIGGASTLFLENNNLSLDSPGFPTSLGEARNLNNLSFSANVGLGLHYDVNSHIRFNLEPIFKYQINTFNNISGLKPYYFGIYSGLSFGF